MNARLRPRDSDWGNPAATRHERIKPTLSSPSTEQGRQPRPVKSPAHAAKEPAPVAGMQPGMTLDEWLIKIGEKKTKRSTPAKPNRAATVQEFEAALARVHGKGASEEPAETPKQHQSSSAPEATRVLQPVRIQPVAREAKPIEPPESDQVAKITQAMNMIADWMDHVDERSVDTSRLVLQQQERTTRVLVSAVTSVSKRLTEMARQIQVLEEKIAALTPPAEPE